jgi:hypothetical protein
MPTAGDHRIENPPRRNPHVEPDLTPRWQPVQGESSEGPARAPWLPAAAAGMQDKAQIGVGPVIRSKPGSSIPRPGHFGPSPPMAFGWRYRYCEQDVKVEDSILGNPAAHRDAALSPGFCRSLAVAHPGAGSSRLVRDQPTNQQLAMPSNEARAMLCFQLFWFKMGTCATPTRFQLRYNFLGQLAFRNSGARSASRNIRLAN